MSLTPQPPALDHVQLQIDAGNPWYVGSQFEWASQPGVWRIYAGRERVFKATIDRQRARAGHVLRVLDVGCGDGYWLHRMAQWPNLALTGVDYNPLRIDRARQAAPQARLIAGDLAAVLVDETFDVIVCSQVIEHIHDDIGALRALHGRLAPGGVLILGTPNEGSARHQRALRARGPHFETDHVHFYREPQIAARLRDAGFTIDSVYREVFYVGHEPLYYWLNARGWGFALLSLLTRLWPSECSDFYFECRRS